MYTYKHIDTYDSKYLQFNATKTFFLSSKSKKINREYVHHYEVFMSVTTLEFSTFWILSLPFLSEL